jgi:hypothetical protein
MVCSMGLDVRASFSTAVLTRQTSASTIMARSTPSGTTVRPDKMSVLTLGGGYGAAIKNER